MRPAVRLLAAAACIALYALPAAAQQNALTADLRTDIDGAEKKFLALARAIPEDRYAWRPGDGVRSVGEVLLHVASDNYLIPGALGFTPDASSGIKADDYKTAQAFEQRKLSKAATIAELEKSFVHLRKSLSDTPSARLSQKVTMFGQSFTMQQAWILTATHLHEHLGQFIAYARSNGVKPPWS